MRTVQAYNILWRNGDRRRRRMPLRGKEIAIWDHVPSCAAFPTGKPLLMGSIEHFTELVEIEGLKHGSRTYANVVECSKRLGRHTNTKIWPEAWREKRSDLRWSGLECCRGVKGNSRRPLANWESQAPAICPQRESVGPYGWQTSWSLTQVIKGDVCTIRPS